MENKNKTKDKVNYGKLNEVFNIGSKILKLLYILIIVLVVYAIMLIFKELKLLPTILTLLKIISPFFIGFFIAWLLNPLVTKLNKKGLKRISAVILIYGLALIFLYFCTLLIIPVIGNQINDIVSTIPNILNNLKDLINKIFDKISDSSLVNLDNTKEEFFLTIETLGKNLMINLPDTFVNIVKGIISAAGVIVFSFIIGFYMLFNFDQVSEHLLHMMPKKIRKDVKTFISSVDKVMYEYVKGTLLISFILMIVCAIGFKIIGLKASLIFGLFCGITNLIPYFGPYIGGAPAVLVGLSQSTATGVLILIFVIIIQVLEGMFLQPIIMSKKMKLHPVTIIIVLLIFGYFFGIIGMILATPLAALIKIIYVFLDEKYGFFNYDENEEL